jgi:hypothetical protein
VCCAQTILPIDFQQRGEILDDVRLKQSNIHTHQVHPNSWSTQACRKFKRSKVVHMPMYNHTWRLSLCCPDSSVPCSLSSSTAGAALDAGGASARGCSSHGRVRLVPLRVRARRTYKQTCDLSKNFIGPPNTLFYQSWTYVHHLKLKVLKSSKSVTRGPSTSRDP